MSGKGNVVAAFALGGIAVAGVVIGAVAWVSIKAERVLDPPSKVLMNRETSTIGAGQQLSYAFPAMERRYFEIDVVERFGKNIEFRFLSNGQEVGASGVHKGHATGAFLADEGTASLLIVNSNIIESKSVIVTVKASKLTPGD